MPSQIPNYVSPSAIVQEILQRRRGEARQVMLDKLNDENVRSQMADRTSQLGLDQRRVATDETRTTQLGREADERILTSQIASMGDTESEITPEWKGANQPLYDELVKRQRVRRDTITPKTGFSYEVQPPEEASPEQIEQFDRSMEGGAGSMDMAQVAPTQQREMYTGSPEFQRTQAGQRQIVTYLQNNPQIAKTNPELFQLLQMQAQAGNVDVPASMVEPAPSFTAFSPITGKSMGTQQLPRGGQGGVLPHAPMPPSAYITPQSQIFPNPKDSNKPWVYWIKPGQPLSEAQPVAPYIEGQTGRVGNINNQRASQLVPSTIWNSYNMSFSRRQGESEEAWRARQQQGRSTIAANINVNTTTPNVRDFVSRVVAIINNSELAGDPAPNIQQIMTNAQRSGLSENEINDAVAVLNGIISGGMQGAQ